MDSPDDTFEEVAVRDAYFACRRGLHQPEPAGATEDGIYRCELCGAPC